ncbi:adenosylcobinamide-GDP ribazoletransferase [Bacillus sp. FJAT-47783]|uniref:adenosylcobinamide-GDP ribazoletransferase n=1 Tax=Bacillus sp. FJAT-47783 TaxID=2922712 RepID=UPI001FACEB3C
MKDRRDGFILALQFFSVIPISKEIPLDRFRLKYGILSLPILGAIIGVIGSVLLWGLHQWTPFSDLALTLFFLFYFIFITGGIHIDGWVDTSDAFFSYRDPKRRLEIMKDPRVGTFGVLSLLFLLLFRFLFAYEIIQSISFEDLILFATIPILSRISMGVLFIAGPGLAKREGLAYLFVEALRKRDLLTFLLYLVLLLVVYGVFFPHLLLTLLILMFSTCMVFFGFKLGFKRAFGGITGDTLGTSIEGTETILWMIVWLLHLYATV